MSGLKKYMIIGTILLVAYLLVQYFTPKPTDWTATYAAKDKIPFGTYILRQQLNQLFPATKVEPVQTAIYNTLQNKPKGRSNYVLVAGTLKVDSLDYREMVKYMQEGNNIFIAANQIQGILLDTLNLELKIHFSFRSKRKFPINFVNPSLKRELDYYFDKGTSGQHFVRIDTARAIVLGQVQNERANFVQYKFGRGALFIMANPQLLTNYNLLKEEGRDYAAKALSYLPKAQYLLWDEYFTKRDENKGAVLRVFFEYEQLKWAYYIALFSLIVFVLFEIKRRQRIIPVIERPKNTSVEFVQVVGRVYYQQRNNRDIAEKKVVYLLAYIRNKYRIKTNHLDQAFEEALIHSSVADAEVIKELLQEINYLNAGQVVKDAQLIRLNKLIEQFYKQDQ